MQRLVLVTALCALAACAPPPAETIPPATSNAEVEDAAATGWRAIVSAEDAERIAGLAGTWRDALAAAHRLRGRIRAEGELLAPDAARNHPAPPPGSYRCRLVKLGAALGREAPLRSFPEFFCHVRGDRSDSLFFTKQTGTELPGGFLHPDGERRLVLAGARQRSASEAPLIYGDDPPRDLVGVVERIGPFHWRLVLPWRDGATGLDIYELTPVPPEQQAAEPPPVNQPGADTP
jgi:hypothetical protein